MAQGELHHARIHNALELAKGSRRSQSKTRVREVHIVEDVESFNTELYSLSFPRQLEYLCDGHIGVEHMGQTDSGASPSVAGELIGKGIRGVRVRKDARITVLIDLHSGFRGLSKNGEGAQPIIGVVFQSTCYRGRQPRAVAYQAGNLPSANDPV